MKKNILPFLVILILLFSFHLFGQTWSPTKRLTWGGYSYTPAIAIDSNNHIHVFWEDFAFGNAEIFYKKSTDGGANWSVERITWNSGVSQTPAITVDSGNGIHVIWDDDSPGYFDIFYKNRK